MRKYIIPRLLLLMIICTFSLRLAAQPSGHPLCAEQPITSSERIVFSTYVEDDLQARNVYLFDPERASGCLLLQNINALYLDWSPSGDSIIFSELRTIEGMHVTGIAVVQANGMRHQQLELNPGALLAAQSLDGNQFAYLQSYGEPHTNRIIVQEILTGSIIADYMPVVEQPIYPMGKPEWSPDGRQVAFPAQFLDMIYEYPVPRNIFLVNIEDTNYDTSLEYIAGVPEADNFAPVWSPDGRRIAFTALNEDERHLMISDLQTGDTRLSTLDIASYVHVWLPDGRFAFTAEDGEGYSLYVTDASITGDWTTITQMPLSFDVIQFDWWIDPATLPVPESP